MADPWRDYWVTVGNPDLRAARRICEVSPRVRDFAAARIRGRNLEWRAFANAIEDSPFSPTERALAELAASLATGRPLDVRKLSRLGSCAGQVAAILTDWSTDGAYVVSRPRHTRGPLDERDHVNASRRAVRM